MWKFTNLERVNLGEAYLGKVTRKDFFRFVLLRMGRKMGSRESWEEKWLVRGI